MQYKFPISGRVWDRPKGHVLLPDRFPPSVIAGYKKNPVVWAGQYQQRPSPLGGYIFPTDKWRFYDKRPDLEIQILSVDCTFKSRPENDLVALHVYGVDGGNRFLFDRVAEHLDYPSTKQAIKDLRIKWPKISYVLIEDKANGPAVISELRREMPGLLPIEPEGGKEARAHASAADVYSGSVYLPNPENYGWVQPLIDLFSTYNGEGSVEFDDDIDAFSQFINWARSLFNGAATWLDGEYEKVQKAKDPTAATEHCPKCKKPISYMSGVWFCSGCSTRGSDSGSCKSVTRVGF